MTLWRRFKNLWELSAYRVGTKYELEDGRTYKVISNQLLKDVPTIEKKLAKIINIPKIDLFEDVTY